MDSPIPIFILFSPQITHYLTPLYSPKNQNAPSISSLHAFISNYATLISNYVTLISNYVTLVSTNVTLNSTYSTIMATI